MLESFLNFLKLSFALVFLLLALSYLIAISGFGYLFFSYFLNSGDDDKQEYHYWHELIAKNPKPENVSQAEFIVKNKEGYCWRDRTYYSEKELKERAMVHFSETLLNHIQRAKEGKLTKNNGGVERKSAQYCRENETECALWFAPTEETNKDFKQSLINNPTYSPRNIITLNNFNSKQVWNPVDLAYYISSSDSYALFHNSYPLNMIFGADCCSIATEADIKTTPKKTLVSTADNFSAQGEIPPDINDITEYGVGVYYFSADYFSYNTIKENVNNQVKYKNTFYDMNDLYFLSNCGEILFKPFYKIN